MGTFSKTFGVCLAQQGAKLNYPAILKDGNTVAWFDYKELSSVIKDGSNLVSRWNDKLKSGNDLIQSTQAYQPLSTSDGISFDGDDDFMQTSGIASLIQPETVYLVFKQISDISGRFILDGLDNASMRLSQAGNGYNIVMNSGGSGILGYYNVIGGFIILIAQFNGSSSFLKINYSPKEFGNCGTSNANGITLSALANGGYVSKNEFKEAIFRRAIDSDETIGAIYNYLAKKHFSYTVIVGDSTSSDRDIQGLVKVSSLMSYSKGIYDISYSGDAIADQKVKWLSSDLSAVKCVFVMVGLNDCYTLSDSEIIAAYQDLINTIRTTIGAAGKIIAVTMIPCSYSVTTQWQALNQAILGGGSTPITGTDGTIDTVNTALNSGTNTLSAIYDCGDALHENNLGRQLIADLYDAKLTELGF